MAKTDADSKKTFTLELGGCYGEFHCMKCQRICNFETDSYCCDATRDMPPPQQRAESYFLMICLQRHAIDEMVRALIAGKKVVDKKGHCVFCRNTKQHEEEKWCAGKTVMELYLHQVDKEERKIDKHLEKYLETLIKNRKEKLEINAGRALKGTVALLEDCMPEDELAHRLAKQGRDARRNQRKELNHVEVENDAIRRRLAAKLKSKRRETMRKIEQAMKSMKV